MYIQYYIYDADAALQTELAFNLWIRTNIWEHVRIQCSVPTQRRRNYKLIIRCSQSVCPPVIARKLPKKAHFTLHPETSLMQNGNGLESTLPSYQAS